MYCTLAMCAVGAPCLNTLHWWRFAGICIAVHFSTLDSIVYTTHRAASLSFLPGIPIFVCFFDDDVPLASSDDGRERAMHMSEAIRLASSICVANMSSSLDVVIVSTILSGLTCLEDVFGRSVVRYLRIPWSSGVCFFWLASRLLFPAVSRS